jgi:hypothetical protein
MLAADCYSADNQAEISAAARLVQDPLVLPNLRFFSPYLWLCDQLRDLLREAFFALRRDAAPGIDGLTWQAYEGPE